MTTLVYHAGGLGDFLAIFPAIRAWRLARSPAKIILLGKPAFGALGVHGGYFDALWDVDSARFSRLFLPESGPMPESVGDFSQINSALLFAAPDSPLASRLSGAGVKEIFHLDPFPAQRIPIALHHLSQFPGYAQLLDHFGPLLRADAQWGEARRRRLPPLKDFIAIAPGSGSGLKNWPLDNYVRLAGALQEKGINAVWLCGPAEESMRLPRGAVAIRGEDLLTVAQVIARSAGFIGNDSGLAHLAAGLGRPCLVLFGPSDPEIWRPHGANVRIVASRRPCSPCHQDLARKGRCAKGCMQLIEVEEVFEAAMGLWA